MTTKIGANVARIDALDKVTGKTLFPADLTRPNMLHMKILFSGRPHARVRSIDISKAESHPGVVAVFTAVDVPVNEYGQYKIYQLQAVNRHALAMAYDKHSQL